MLLEFIVGIFMTHLSVNINGIGDDTDTNSNTFCVMHFKASAIYEECVCVLLYICIRECYLSAQNIQNTTGAEARTFKITLLTK